jgi:hypothetical protein
MADLNESEFRLVTMGFGATLAEVDEACRERCARLGQPCFAVRNIEGEIVGPQTPEHFPQTEGGATTAPERFLLMTPNQAAAKRERLLGRIMVMRARKEALQERIYALEAERRALLSNIKGDT